MEKITRFHQTRTHAVCQAVAIIGRPISDRYVDTRVVSLRTIMSIVPNVATHGLATSPGLVD